MPHARLVLSCLAFHMGRWETPKLHRTKLIGRDAPHPRHSYHQQVGRQTDGQTDRLLLLDMYLTRPHHSLGTQAGKAGRLLGLGGYYRLIRRHGEERESP